MGRCNQCKKKIKWVQMVERDNLRWLAFDIKTRARHVCTAKPKPRDDDKPPPWWIEKD